MPAIAVYDDAAMNRRDARLRRSEPLDAKVATACAIHHIPPDRRFLEHTRPRSGCQRGAGLQLRRRSPCCLRRTRTFARNS